MSRDQLVRALEAAVIGEEPGTARYALALTDAALWVDGIEQCRDEALSFLLDLEVDGIVHDEDTGSDR